VVPCSTAATGASGVALAPAALERVASDVMALVPCCVGIDTAGLPPLAGGTFELDLVRAQWADGTSCLLVCKHGGRHPDNPHDNYGSVRYEAEVYERFLVPRGLCPLRFWGSRHDAVTSEAWLLIEYVEDSVHARRADDGAALRLAAGWIGDFHRRTLSPADAVPGFITRYDMSDLGEWPRRLASYVDRSGRSETWLDSVNTRFGDFADRLTGRPPCVVHGDLYSDNVLVRDGRVHIIDWGWTAVAPGELDLASLLEGCSPDVHEVCVDEYARARWPDGVDHEFEAGFVAAQFVHLYRWLTFQPERVGTKRWTKRLKRLKKLARGAGLIS
jgi:hypothetical protein